MDEPRSLPACRYYPDGRVVLVHTMDDYRALAPGHADNPSGPFPAPVAPGGETPHAEACLPATWEPEPTPPDDKARGHEARRRYVAGQSQRTIALALGASRHTVARWLKEDDDAL